MLVKLLLLVVIIYLVLKSMNTIEGFEEHKYTPNEIYQHLSYISDKLDTLGIRYWLMYGTLLGCVRNNDIIPHDYDFDFGALIDDLDVIMTLNETIKGDGYKLEFPQTYSYDYKTLTKRENKWRVSVKIYYNNIAFGDIYLYSRCRDNYLRRYDPNQKILFWPQSTIHSNFINNLVRGRIRDRYFWIPSNSEFLLQYWYGKDWNIPIVSESQGGKKREDYDYYGGYKKMELCNMTSFINQLGIFDRPNMTEQIEWIFPKEQYDWHIKNDFSN